MKSIKKEYTAPKAEIIEFECEEDILLASGLKTKGYTSVGTKSWFEGLGGSVSTPNANNWTDSIGNGQ